MRRSIVTVIFFSILFLMSCENSTTKSKLDKYSGIINGVDFDALFEEPNQTELNSILQQWDAYEENIVEMAIVDTHLTLVGAEIRNTLILSHKNYDNITHYGAVILPTDNSQTYPVMFYNHGGDNGVNLNDFSNMIRLVPDMVEIAANHIIAIPSFRSESLIIGQDEEEYKSTGTPSPWDKDVEDCMEFLTTLAHMIPEVNEEEVSVVGLSRGGGVSMLWAARDSRVDKVVDFFGPSKLISDWTKEITYNALEGTLEELPGLDYLNEEIIQPLKNQELSIEIARLELIKRSPYYFLKDITPLQIHHGLEDEIVPVTQSEAMIEKASELNLNEDEFQSFLYQYGGHDQNTFIQGVDEMKNFIFN